MMTARIALVFFLLLLVPVAVADPPPEDEEGVVTLTDDELVVSDAESYERYVQAAQIADRSIMAYIVRSTESIQQGHRQGFAEFREWYRARDSRIRSEQATAQLMNQIIGGAIGGAVSSVVPGSGIFVNMLQAYVNNRCQAALRSAGGFTSGDVDRFLDQHERTLEGVITGMLDFPDQFRDEHPEILEAARMEFIQEHRSSSDGGSPSSEVGGGTQRILRDAGVPAPGAVTATRVAEGILTRQIRAVVATDRLTRQSVQPWVMDVIAEAEAMRHLYPRDPDRYCPVEREAGGAMAQTEECRNWRPRSEG